MVITIKEPAKIACEPPTKVSCTHSYNRAVVHWQPPFQKNETDQSKQIIDPDIKYYMIYVKEGDMATYICHGYVYPPFTTYIINNIDQFLSGANTLEIKVYTIDKQGRKSAAASIAADPDPVTTVETLSTDSQTGPTLYATKTTRKFGKIMQVKSLKSIDGGVNWTEEGNIA